MLIECFICASIWLCFWANSYRLLYYNYMAISNWFELTICFLTLIAFPTSFFKFKFLYISCLFSFYRILVIARYTTWLQFCQVCMHIDLVGLVWLDLLLYKILLQASDMVTHSRGCGHMSVELCVVTSSNIKNSYNKLFIDLLNCSRGQVSL